MLDDLAAERAPLFVGDSTSPLVDEGELLLLTELPDASGYFRIMAAVAAGHTRFSELKDVARMDPTRAIDRLTTVQLLERLVPVTDDPDATRTRVYRLADNFLSFWFRFVYPARGAIRRGLGHAIVRERILPMLDDHMGPAFEGVCRDYVWRKAADGTLPGITNVGSWWTRDGQRQVDVVAVRDRHVVLAGEAKWSGTVDRRVLHALRDTASALPNRDPDLRYILFARDRFLDVESHEALLVNAVELYE